MNSDIFRPTGALRAELELATSNYQDVIRILGEQLSEQRTERIDAVIGCRTRRLAVAVEGVHDPHNTAAIMRTADALGIQTFHVIENGTSFLSSRKVTQGAHKWLDLGVWRGCDEFLEAMGQHGYKVLVAAADGNVSVGDLNTSDEKMVLVFGNEAEGISSPLREGADGTFCVPMVGFVDSFNVSVAAAISMFAVRAGRSGDLASQEKEVLKARYYLRAVKSGYDIVQEALRRN